jgi:hypothetical protein
MSDTKAQPQRKQWAKHRLFEGVTIGQPVGRLIVVEVYENEGRHSVHWRPVVGLLTATVSEYSQELRLGRHVDYEFRNHDELRSHGWELDRSPSVEIYPVVAGKGDVEPPLFAAGVDDHLEASNMRHRVVVPCDWPPDQDRENAIRIGRQLLKGGVLGLDRWVDLDPPSDPS